MKRIWIAAILLFLATTAVPARYSVSPPANAAMVNSWAGYALLKHITSCESWGDPNKEPREFTPDGNVLHGYPNPNDIGLGQINVPTWGAKAKELGFDLYTYAGNLAMAQWIFARYGSAPWKYSKGCWGKYQTHDITPQPYPRRESPRSHAQEGEAPYLLSEET
jgi:hypothetical protein